MLVLSREINEVVCIAGGAIRIMVVDVRGNKVKLGIQAPPSIEVHREEVQLLIDAEKEAGDAHRANR